MLSTPFHAMQPVSGDRNAWNGHARRKTFKLVPPVVSVHFLSFTSDHNVEEHCFTTDSCVPPIAICGRSPASYAPALIESQQRPQCPGFSVC